MGLLQVYAFSISNNKIAATSVVNGDADELVLTDATKALALERKRTSSRTWSAPTFSFNVSSHGAFH